MMNAKGWIIIWGWVPLAIFIKIVWPSTGKPILVALLVIGLFAPFIAGICISISEGYHNLGNVIRRREKKERGNQDKFFNDLFPVIKKKIEKEVRQNEKATLPKDDSNSFLYYSD